jgi:hypothetical protein
MHHGQPILTAAAMSVGFLILRPVEQLTELPPNELLADPVRLRPGRIERYARHAVSPCHISWVSFVTVMTERDEEV